MRLVLALPALLAACTGPGPMSDFDVTDVKSELLGNVEQIRQAELALQAVDDFLPCADAATARASATATPRTWEGPDCWVRIGWAPDAAVRGGYWVEVAADKSDFTVHGVFDADGDGTWMQVTATKGDKARVVTPGGVQ